MSAMDCYDERYAGNFCKVYVVSHSRTRACASASACASRAFALKQKCVGTVADRLAEGRRFKTPPTPPRRDGRQ